VWQSPRSCWPSPAHPHTPTSQRFRQEVAYFTYPHPVSSGAAPPIMWHSNSNTVELQHGGWKYVATWRSARYRPKQCKIST
jgi:hypothetical protein